MGTRAKKYGKEPVAEKIHPKPIEVCGVGNGTQRAVWKSKIPIAVTTQDGKAIEQVFEVPVLEGQEGADVPALLGLRSMRAKNAVLEMAPGREMLTFPGPGDYKVEWPPGTVHIPLEIAPSGHYVIPCDNYKDLSTRKGGIVENPEDIMVLHSNECDQLS